MGTWRRSSGGRHRRRQFLLISTDGVFSMDGYIARLDEICALADRYNAWFISTTVTPPGFIGAKAAARMICAAAWTRWISSPAPWARHWAVPVVATPRRRGHCRPAAPALPSLPVLHTVRRRQVAGAIKAIELVDEGARTAVRLQLAHTLTRSGQACKDWGWGYCRRDIPSCPVMLHDASLAVALFAQELLKHGVRRAAFSFRWFPTGAHPHPDVGGTEQTMISCRSRWRLSPGAKAAAVL